MSVAAHFVVNNRECLLKEETEDHEHEIQAAASMDYICGGDSGGDSMYLQYQLMMRYVWTGSYRWDYCFHAFNFHPLLACFLSHPAHPYNRYEHLGVLTITVAFSAALTSYVWRAYHGAPPEGFMGEIIIALFITLPVTIATAFCESVIIGSWFVEYGADQWNSSSCGGFFGLTKYLKDLIIQCNVCKQSVLAFNVVVSLILCIGAFISINIKRDFFTALGETVGPVLKAQFYSWIVWFMSDMGMFCYRWSGEKYFWGS